MPDEEIREGAPEKGGAKKKPRDEDDRPRRKRPREDEDDDDFDRKSRRIAREDDDGSNSPLSAVVPVGVSIWALAAFYLSLLGCVVPGFGVVAIFCGIMAFVTHKHQASYGSISGNLRAIMGIVIGVIVTAAQLIMIIALLAGR